MADLIQVETSKEEAERIAEQQLKEMNGTAPGRRSLIEFEDDPGKTNNFLILYQGVDSEGEMTDQFWQNVTGRDEAFQNIINNIDNIDIMKSYILVEVTEPDSEGGFATRYENRKTLYTYLMYCINNELVPDELIPNGFDPDDYVVESISDEEYNL